MDIEELRSRIEKLITLTEGCTLDSTTGDVLNKAYWYTTFSRTFYGDSRTKTVEYVKELILSLKTYCISSPDIMREMYKYIEPSKHAIIRMKSTYAGDEETTLSLDSILNTLRGLEQLHDLEIEETRKFEEEKAEEIRRLEDEIEQAKAMEAWIIQEDKRREEEKLANEALEAKRQEDVKTSKRRKSKYSNEWERLIEQEKYSSLYVLEGMKCDKKSKR